MLDAAKAVNGGAGVLSIVKNYTGDVMNFEMAAELAQDEGIEVEQVVIDDDVAVKDSLYTAGRRGVGATVLAEKICGAAAEQLRPLADVAALCRKVTDGARSMGVALTSGTVPMAGKPTFELGADEMEIGIGIHGEPGRERRKLAPAHEIVEALATAVVEDLPFSCGDEVLAFVNGMAAPRSWSSTWSTTSCTSCSRAGASRSRATSSGRTSRRSTWPAARSRCSGWTTSSRRCGTRR